jgi:hypothetical protein
MPRLRYDAKLTHRRYGISKYPDVLERREKRTSVTIIKSHNAIIQAKEKKYSFKLKKKKDQKKLKMSCTAYTVMAEFMCFCKPPEVITRYEAIPISTKSIDHTTGKSQPGGESRGFSSAEKSFIAPMVAMAEIPPTTSGTAMQAIKSFHFIFISVPHIKYFYI